MDFGIARIVGSDMTGTGTLLGTFGYMAPEYIKTGVLDPRCDLFAVGVILYEALGGHRPFTGEATATVLYQVVNEEPAPLHPTDFHGISPKTGLLLAKALAKDPFKRFPSAEALAKALRDAKDPAWAGPTGSVATKDSARPPVVRSSTSPAHRSKAWPWLAAAMILGGFGVGGWLWWQNRTEPRVITLDSVPPGEAPSAGSPKVEAVPETPRPPKADGPERPAPRGPAKPAPAMKAQVLLTDEEVAGLLNEAAKGLMDQPQGSLAACDRVLKDHPMNPRAYALKATALYGLGRYQEMPGVLAAGKEHGVKPVQFLAYGHFTAMLREERRERRLPAGVREALAEVLPFTGARAGQGAWQPRNQ
jgi:serine/threonine-protein kinase